MKAVLLFVLAVLAHPGLARSGAAPALLQPLSLTLLQPHSLVFNATVGLARRLGETTNSRYYGEMLPGAHSEGVELLQEWLGELIESSIQVFSLSKRSASGVAQRSIFPGITGERNGVAQQLPSRYRIVVIVELAYSANTQHK